MEVGIYEAKSKLSRLVQKVEAGEEVVLTRHGKPVARIVTFAPAAKGGRRTLLREIRALARRVRIPPEIRISEVLAEGRD
ncbi:MAG: type II toxin-antitoxin system prevent-host-death family antitoxin [Burkholderiales bacterium]|nr:type II toxin-antitoxin system prevent-host-death family antitoxin [Burkholderiales bacterium]